MKASDLKYTIDIYKLTISTSPYGDTKRTWTKRCTTRARVNYSSGSRTIENDEIFYMVDREFIIRHYVPVEETDIIVWNDDKWRILSIDHNHEYNNIFIRTTKIMDEDIILTDGNS